MLKVNLNSASFAVWKVTSQLEFNFTTNTMDSDRRSRDVSFEDIEKYNQPVELENIDLADTAGLLDDDDDDDDDHPMINSSRRRTSTVANVSRNVKLSQGIFVLFAIFVFGKQILYNVNLFLGAVILIIYRSSIKPQNPSVTTPIIVNQAYIQQSWPLALCLTSNYDQCNRVSKYEDFVITDIAKINSTAGCGTEDEKKNFDQKKVDPKLVELWAAPYTIQAYWGKVF